MFDVQVYGAGLAVGLVMGVLGWLVSLARRSVSVADSVWPLLFVGMTITYILLAPPLAERAYVLLFLVTVWAVRLSVFVTLRNWNEPEDHRYQAIRAANEPDFAHKSLYMVFGMQAILAWLVSLPLLGTVLGAAPLGLLDIMAVALWLLGFGFEAIGDQQLAHFRADPANRSRVLDRGLWRYTRHPNYFGDACIWWSFYLLACSAGAWWTILGPVLMTFLLLRVGGVPLIEQSIGDRRPAYRDYSRRTNAFLPGPPRTAADI
jgi:steroid 5-alpha reductase family enzyme